MPSCGRRAAAHHEPFAERLVLPGSTLLEPGRLGSSVPGPICSVRPKTSIACAAAALLCGPPVAAHGAADATRYAGMALLGGGRTLTTPASPRVVRTVRAPFTFDLVGARWRARGTVHV